MKAWLTPQVSSLQNDKSGHVRERITNQLVPFPLPTAVETTSTSSPTLGSQGDQLNLRNEDTTNNSEHSEIKASSICEGN
jgi:hypothetical protein